MRFTPRVPSATGPTQVAFAALMGAASLIGLLKTAVFAKVLGVDDLGLYGVAVIVTQFGVHLSTWGILHALNNQLPLALGRGEARTPALIGRALGGVLLCSALTGALYLAVVAVVRPGSDGVRLALVLAVALVMSTTLFEFVLLLLRVERRLLPLGAMYLLRAAVATLLGAAAGSRWGFSGVVAVEVVTLLAVTLTARGRWLKSIRVLRPNRPELRWLIARGAPLMLANLIVVSSATVDRVFVAVTLPDSLGQYVFATIVVTAWLAVSGIVVQALAPRYLFEHGAGLQLAAVWAKSMRVIAMAAAAGLAGLPVLLVATAALKNGTYAEYRAGLSVMPILYVGGLLYLLTFPGFILAALRPTRALAAAAAGAIVAVTGGALVAALGPSLAGFAWVFVASQATVLIVVLIGIFGLVRVSLPSEPIPEARS
jgi:O-antigen/teichoic acid export membrane protein